MRHIAILIVASIFINFSIQPTFAQNQPKGHIFNIDGDKCKFTQTTTAEKYLHSLKANTGHLIFDDPNCMSAEGISLEVNEMMIANFVVKRYAQPDAAFQTRSEEFRNGSLLQVRGICIQSATYSGIGIVVEFQINGSHFSGVKHAMAVQGCSN